MSGPIRRGLGANYTAQGWYALASVAIVPLFLRVFGAEAYGLVGAFLVLQACAVALDAGLAAAFAREIVALGQGHGGASSAQYSMRSKERTIALIALVFATLVIAAAAYLASHGLDPVKLAPGTVAVSIQFMAVAVAARVLSGFHRLGLFAVGAIRSASLVSLATTTLRTFGAVAAGAWLGADVSVYFAAQAVIGIAEVVVLRALLQRHLADSSGASARGGGFEQPGFGPAMALATVLWMATMQVDKVALSAVVDLDAFATYSLAAVVAGAVASAGLPLLQVAQPRASALVLRGDLPGLEYAHATSTALLCALSCAAALAAILGVDPFLDLWNAGSRPAGSLAALVAWLALGNVALNLAALLFQLQVAHGSLRLQLAGTAAFALVLAMATTMAAVQGGVIATAVAWGVTNLVWLVVWSLIVHRRFMPAARWTWLGRDIAVPAISVFLAGILANPLVQRLDTPALRLLCALGAAALGLAAACLAHPTLRRSAGSLLDRPQAEP